MHKNPIRIDKRRLLVIPGSVDETLHFSVENWIEIADNSIKDHGFFAVALSGGSTPKKIFQQLTSMSHKIDWSKVYLFWSDERSVPPNHPNSNYKMALEEGGLSKLPILKDHIFRMVAEVDIQKNAFAYEQIIQKKLGAHPFDLVMLGMGEDGHTASLFPFTQALHDHNKWVAANYIPQKECWRMTLTYECINQARHICLYVIGNTKASILKEVLLGEYNYERYPSQNIGTNSNPALWIADLEACQSLPHFTLSEIQTPES